jgi:hypothetical protein
MDRKCMSYNFYRAAGRAKIDVVFLRPVGFAVLLAIVAVYYLFLLSNGTFQIFAPEMLDKTFNSMLVHLLAGDFTVDREAIGFEAFTRDGKTYAYFGIFPAVLRVFAMPFTDIERADLARLSCLTAVLIFVILQLRMLLIVHDSLPAGNRGPGLLAVMVAATVLSGPQLYILGSAWVYHEPVLWSAAMAAVFNLIIIRAAFGRKSFRTPDLALLATLAGLALNTRASIGVALYLSTVLLISWEAWCRHAPDNIEWRCSRKWKLLQAKTSVLARDMRVLLPIFVMGVLAAVVGIINFERWGNPFTFVNFYYEDYANYYRQNDFAVLRNYGEISLSRLWIGALYYATGIPYFVKGIQPFADFFGSRYQGIEAPPITPVMTNPLTLLLAAIGLYRVFWKPELVVGCRTILGLSLIGHASAVLLIFSVWYLALRYRFDLAPFVTLAALVGYGSVSKGVTEARESWRKRVYIAAIGLCFLGILSSHYVLLVHKVWSFGVPPAVRHALLPFVPFAYHTLGP